MARTIETALYPGGLSVFTQYDDGRIRRIMFIYSDGSFDYEGEFDRLTQSEIDFINANKYQWFKDWKKFDKEIQPMPKC